MLENSKNFAVAKSLVFLLYIWCYEVYSPVLLSLQSFNLERKHSGYKYVPSNPHPFYHSGPALSREMYMK